MPGKDGRRHSIELFLCGDARSWMRLARRTMTASRCNLRGADVVAFVAPAPSQVEDDGMKAE